MDPPDINPALNAHHSLLLFILSLCWHFLTSQCKQYANKSNPTICFTPVLQEHFQSRLGMQWQTQPVFICSKSSHWDLPEEFPFQLSSFPNSPSTSRVGLRHCLVHLLLIVCICSVSILQYAGSAGRIAVCRSWFFELGSPSTEPGTALTELLWIWICGFPFLPIPRALFRFSLCTGLFGVTSVAALQPCLAPVCFHS